MVPYAAVQSAFPTVLTFGYDPLHVAWQLFTLPSPLSAGQPDAAGEGFGLIEALGDGEVVTMQVESACFPLI